MDALSAATLNGLRCTSARVTVPAWGCWYAEAQIDGEHDLSGRVELKIADLILSGTVLSGGPALGRSSFRIVAGAGGWGKPLPRKGYANDAGVKAATVLGDAAEEVGETLAAPSVADRVGPAYVRQAGPASASLQAIAPDSWYVDEAGTTRLGARAAGVLPANVTRIVPVDQARGRVVLASDSLAAILPGVVVDGMTAVDVCHEVTASSGLRSTVWGAKQPAPLGSLAAILAALDPDRAYRGVTEYRVVISEGHRLSLQAVRASSGMPDLRRVPVRPGVAGCSATVALGARVLVGFVDSDPARPYVAGFEDADGSGFLPTSLDILGGTQGVAREGDAVSVTVTTSCPAGAGTGTGTGTITAGSLKVRCG